MSDRLEEAKRWAYMLPRYQFDHVLAIIEDARDQGVDAAAKALEADAQLCDCHAHSEDECACGAWCEWKTVPMHRAVEIVRALKGDKQ